MSSDKFKYLKIGGNKIMSFFGIDEEFEERFFKVMPVFFVLRMVCHICGMLFGFFVIKSNLAENTESTLLSQYVTLASITIVVLIEGFFSVCGKNAMDQFLNPLKELKNIWRVAFFMLFASGFYYVFIYSIYLSETGGEVKGKEFAGVYEKKEDNFLIEKKDNEIKKTSKRYEGIFSDIKEGLTNEKSEIKNRYKAKIDFRKSEKKRYLGIYNKSPIQHKWAKGSAAKEQREIGRLIEKREIEIADASKKSNALLSKEKLKLSAKINYQDSVFNAQISQHNNIEDKNFEVKQQEITKYGLYGKYLGLGFVFGAAICMLFERIYFRATGKEYTEKLFGESNNLFSRSLVLLNTLITFIPSLFVDLGEWITGIDFNGNGKIGEKIVKLISFFKWLVGDVFKKKEIQSTDVEVNQTNELAPNLVSQNLVVDDKEIAVTMPIKSVTRNTETPDRNTSNNSRVNVTKSVTGNSKNNTETPVTTETPKQAKKCVITKGNTQNVTPKEEEVAPALSSVTGDIETLATETPKHLTETPRIIQVVDGMPQAEWHGNFRSLDWFKDTRRAYNSRFRKRKQSNGDTSHLEYVIGELNKVINELEGK